MFLLRATGWEICNDNHKVHVSLVLRGRFEHRTAEIQMQLQRGRTRKAKTKREHADLIREGDFPTLEAQNVGRRFELPSAENVNHAAGIDTPRFQ